MRKPEDQRAYQREWYERNRERILAKQKARWAEKRDDLAAYQRQHRAENLEVYREKSRAWKAKNADKHREGSRRYSREHAAEISEARKVQRRALKLTVINAYGGSCACCGEAAIEFLTLDHTAGDGAEHRRSLGMQGGRSHILYRHLIENGFPQGFRVLCFNCNSARGFYGYCPHNPADTLGVPPTRLRPTS